MMCLGRTVIQLDPHSSDFSNSSNQSNSSNFKEDLLLPYEVASNLLKNSGATWNDVVYVYQFVSRELDLSTGLRLKFGRKSKPDYVQDHVYIYFQRANGERDFKYVPGLDFLVPVDNLFKDMVKFFTGGRI